MYGNIWQIINQEIGKMIYLDYRNQRDAKPIKVGGLDNLDFGFAEYAAGEAEKTFVICKI